MKILEYFNTENQEIWLAQIKESDWAAGTLLYELVRDGKIAEFLGEHTKILLLTDGDKLVSYCTFAKKDDIQPTELTPWIGFVYTYPEYRGGRHVGALIQYAENLAKEAGVVYTYISTGHIGLYEKYGYEFFQMMPDINGENSRVYRKRLL